MPSSPSTTLVIDRRLAIALLHEAQVAAPERIEGVLLAHAGQPSRYLPQARAASGVTEEIWAKVYSNPQSPAVPNSSQLLEGKLTLLISLTTKGVLQLRAWTLQQGLTIERIICIKD